MATKSIKKNLSASAGKEEDVAAQPVLNRVEAKVLPRQRISGKILSDKMNETVVVQVEKLKRHPKYKKTYRVSTRYKAHNEGNQYKEGEYVLLEATRPLSKEKRWRIVGKVKG